MFSFSGRANKTQPKHKKLPLGFIALFISTALIFAWSGIALADAAPATSSVSHTNTSNNWAGYIARGSAYSGIGASWTVPTSTSTGLAVNATWVGIGGISSTNLIQAGTQAINELDGSTEYMAWYELMPATMVTVPLGIQPKDSMTVSIKESASDAWTIIIRDNTTDQSYSTTIDYALTPSSAEWIEEIPKFADGSPSMPLDDFGSVNFNKGYTVENGNMVDISQSSAEPLTMISSDGETLAIPSGLDAAGSAFSVTQ